jgi:hypothetical protein
MKKYTFCYYGWLPYYEDFDVDWVDVEATSEEEARENLAQMVKDKKLFPKGDFGLEAINGIEVSVKA